MSQHPVKSVTTFSTGEVRIHAQHAECSGWPVPLWLLLSRTWGPPRLARVEVDWSSETPTVTVGTGLRADAAVRICDAMIYDYHTDLRPDEPLVADRSVSDEPEG